MTAPEKKTLEEVWGLIAELTKAQKETDRQFKETDRQLRESKIETDRQLRESQKKVDHQIEKMVKNVNRITGHFDNRWGKFVESLVKGDIVKKFSARGIKVKDTSQNETTTFEGKQYEFDILVHNGEENIVVEVKTSLETKKVKDFVEKLKIFKKLFPRYSKNKIYGAVAYISADRASIEYTKSQNLFLIEATGDSSRILNPEDFKPRVF